MYWFEDWIIPQQVHVKEAMESWELCLLCEKYFPSVDSLSKHIASSHKTDKSENNEILDQLVKSEAESSSSSALVKQLTSLNSEKTPTKQSNILQLLPLKTQITAVPSKKQKMSFPNHPKQASTSPGSIICKFCGVFLKDFTAYFDHANERHVDQVSINLDTTYLELDILRRPLGSVGVISNFSLKLTFTDCPHLEKMQLRRLRKVLHVVGISRPARGSWP